MAFGNTIIALVIVVMSSTFFLSYLRVCAVWHWNRFIAGFFGISWLSIVASWLTILRTIKGIQVGPQPYCTILVVDSGPIFVVPYIASIFNQSAVFLAITIGVYRNTGGNLTFRDGIPLVLGKNLPTFSKALLHDNQVCYM